MKKKLLIALFVIAFSAASNISFAKVNINSELAESIKLYKSGDYAQCYTRLDSAIKKDPSNPLCYYYKAMSSAQIGKKDEALENYQKTLELSSEKSNLVKYAKKGKRCIETPDLCQESIFTDAEDKFIRGKSPSGFSDEARSMFEKLRIEQMMRDMNGKNEVDPQRFRDYRDFSSMNMPSDMPNNDEIVAAVRTLQNAGILNFGTNAYSDLSLLTGANNTSNNLLDLTKMNPQMIQTMLTNSMSLGF